MADTDRILRSSRQGGIRFISWEEEERLRRSVEERRKGAGRKGGYGRRTVEDGITGDGSVSMRKESEGQKGTEKGKERMRGNERERTGVEGLKEGYVRRSCGNYMTGRQEEGSERGTTVSRGG